MGVRSIRCTYSVMSVPPRVTFTINFVFFIVCHCFCPPQYEPVRHWKELKEASTTHGHRNSPVRNPDRQMEVCLSRKPTTSRLCFLQLASDISLISDDQSLAGRGDKPLSICRESGSHLPPSETCHTPSNTPLIEM